VIAILACILAWISLLSALSELQGIRAKYDIAGHLGGVPGYYFTLDKTRREDDINHSKLLPRTFVEMVAMTTPIYAIQLRTPVSVADPRLARSVSADLIFISPEMHDMATLSSFPPCSLIEPGVRREQHSLMLTVMATWRCQLVALPLSLTVLAEGRTTDALVLPLSAINDIAGRNGMDHVTAIWAGLANSNRLEQLIFFAKRRLKLQLDIRSAGDGVRSSVAVLSLTTKIWTVLTGVLLIFGLVLYIQGVFVSLRREAAIRLCVGQSSRTVLGWMATDVSVQSLFMIAFSAIAGCVLFFLFGGTLEWEAMLRAFLAIAAGMIALLLIICVYAVQYMFRSANVIQMTR
jgi:hypothetical protein